MISGTAKETKTNFLKNNPKYSELEDNNHSLGDFYSINEDDEIWLMQCPKGMHISLLKEQKIRLPGRSNHLEFETVAIEYTEPVPHAFGYKNRKAHNSLKIFPVRGNIIMRNRLKVSTPPDGAIEASPVKVPMPTGIKQRHPLHGVDFGSKLEICPQIAERLKHVDEVTQKQKSKKKLKQKSIESNTIAMDSDGDVELILHKKQKQKKKKRKHSSGDDTNEVSVKKKKAKRNGHTGDVAEGEELQQWIKNL